MGWGNMIRLIASDMDGTLLNDFWEISDENAAAIKKAQELGIEFVIATGRPYSNVHVVTEKANLSCAVISLNGATTYDRNGVFIASCPLTREEVRQAQKVLEEEHIYYELMTSHGGFSINKKAYTDIFYYIGNRELAHIEEQERNAIFERMGEERIRNENCRFISSFEEILNDESIVIYKIFGMSIHEEDLTRADKRLKEMESLSISSASHTNIEVNAKNAHKAEAVFNYAASLGIKPEEVMTIGDSFNDFTMLKGAGRGVSMANAHADIRALTKWTTKSNNEHGVAHAIYDMLTELARK